MMTIFAFKKGELKEKRKTLILAYQLRIRIRYYKTDSGFGFQNWADSGFGLPTLINIFS